MVQVSVCPATADRRSQWRALRPVLILGGFVAIWWALMTGVAQAESTPHHHLLDHVRSQVQAEHHATPVRDAVRRVHHDVRATTEKVHHQARNTTRPVTHTVSAVLDRTPLAPVTTKATKTIRTTLSSTVATTRALVAKSAAGPVVGDRRGHGEGHSREARILNRAREFSLTASFCEGPDHLVGGTLFRGLRDTTPRHPTGRSPRPTPTPPATGRAAPPRFPTRTLPRAGRDPARPSRRSASPSRRCS